MIEKRLFMLLASLLLYGAGLSAQEMTVRGVVTGGSDGQPVNAAYFWLTGMLSSFLDNAPTYLAFFNLAGGDPAYS